ncbi:uncharacterized protein LOC142564064 [Dermacentor variabilis]|uniref:uncharacterized protein LOC142564064 n=1 Tax=Dermacentor variabilis TaxID=34621 RepID=UPI003F5C6E3E
MAHVKALLSQVSVAAVLALLSSSTKVKARQCDCQCESWKEEVCETLKRLDRKVSSAINISHKLTVLELSYMAISDSIKKLQTDVKTLQSRGQNSVSNLLHAVPEISIRDVYEKVLEDEAKMLRIAADVNDTKDDRGSLRDALEQVKRDMALERLETSRTIADVQAEARSFKNLLTPEVQRAAALLPKMVAKIERFYRTGEDIMQLLSPRKHIDKTTDQYSLNSVEIEKKNFTDMQENRTKETPRVFSGAIHNAQRSLGNISRNGSQQNIKVSINRVGNLGNASAPTISIDFTRNDIDGRRNSTDTAFYSEVMKNNKFDDINEIEFVGKDGNFSVAIRDSKVIECTEYASNNDNISDSQAMPCDSFPADVDKKAHELVERMAPISNYLAGEEWSIEKAMTFMAEELVKLRIKTDDDALKKKVALIEESTDRISTHLKKVENALMNDIKRSFGNVSFLLKETVDVLREHNLTQLEDRTEDLARNASSLWQSLYNAETNTQLLHISLTNAINRVNIGNNAIFHWMNESLFTSLSQFSTLNESLQNSLAERLMALKAKLEKRNSELEVRMIHLSQSVQECLSAVGGFNHTLELVKIFLDELDGSYNNSIVSAAIKLQANIDDLHQKFFTEIEHLEEMMRNNTSSVHGPELNGWHPDDDVGCPGLDVLASGDNVVLSTHNSGRYRPPDLPSDALPVGSVVRFWCAPAGSHRLSGASELRCLASKRWSSKPPRCQPLPTLEQIMAGNTTETTPSIHYDGLVDDEWTSSDDNGSLVVRPGVNLRLKCLYPRSQLGGNVTWLHNGSVSRYGASVWAKGGPADSGENAYMLEINRTTHQHSGTYSCETLNGTRHSITIKILDVHCNTPAAPENGEVLVKGARQALVGSKARFRCFLGYELRGSDVATCLGSGRWSVSSPKCEEREHFVPPEGSCPRPSLQDGLTVSPDRKWYETGSRVRYSCQGGKVLVGMPSAQCHEGQWMGRNRSCL